MARADLLPKAGTHDAMGRRPIVLLPVVCWLWAALGAGVMRDWLCGAALVMLRQLTRWPGCLGSAHSNGDPAVGLALHFSICYDRLPPRPLCEVDGRAGGPPASAGPMFACYA